MSRHFLLACRNKKTIAYLPCSVVIMVFRRKILHTREGIFCAPKKIRNYLWNENVKSLIVRECRAKKVMHTANREPIGYLEKCARHSSTRHIIRMQFIFKLDRRFIDHKNIIKRNKELYF